MRVLIVHPGPNYSVADVHDGLLKGLLEQPDVEVASVNLDARLTFYSAAHIHRDGEWIQAFERNDAIAMAAKGIEVACYEYWPDVLIVVSGFFVPPPVWAVIVRRPHHVVLWCTESPYEDDRQAQAARYVDTVVLNDPKNVESFQQDINPRTYYLPQSYDPARHHPAPPEPDLECDFAFVGTGFPERIAFFEAVDWTGINFKLGGNWEGLADDSPLIPFLTHERGLCFENSDAAHLYRSAKVNANLYREQTSEFGTADGWALGPREVELAACGVFFMRQPRPEGDELFPMLPTFETPAEFEKQLRWWLAHPEERAAAAAAAHKAVASRSFANTAASLLRLVNGHTKTVR